MNLLLQGKIMIKRYFACSYFSHSPEFKIIWGKIKQDIYNNSNRHYFIGGSKCAEASNKAS